MTDTPIITAGRAETASGARYIGQLCKHFAHKIDVEYQIADTPAHGLARFPWGTCRMRAEDGVLTMEITAPSTEDRDRIKHVIDDHLGRFAWREKLALDWR